MITRYKNQNVQVLRDAKPGDPGFDEGRSTQAIIKLHDGSEATVEKTALKHSDE